jgi:hypothetical protein
MTTAYSMPALHAKHSVYGIYPNRPAAENGVGQLKRAGFAPSDVSIVIPNTAPAPIDPANASVDNAEMGAMAGGLFGWMAGIGAMAIPGFGAAIAGGPIAWAVLTVGALTGAGGLIGGLIGLGIPEKESHHYHSRLHTGDILLSVHCENADAMLNAKEALIQTGAEDVYTLDAAKTS